jgi:aryl-alcohol dehydrogenase-like predicted oxidoreductase
MLHSKMASKLGPLIQERNSPMATYAAARSQGEAREANLQLVAKIGETGMRKGATPARIALAWLLTQKPWIVPIPGTTRHLRLRENIGAANMGTTAEYLGELSAILTRMPVQGARYTEQNMRLVGRRSERAEPPIQHKRPRHPLAHAAFHLPRTPPADASL